MTYTVTMERTKDGKAKSVSIIAGSSSEASVIAEERNKGYAATGATASVAEIRALLQAGAEAAGLDTTPGQYFRGAFGAASDAGHKRESIDYRMFCTAYGAACPKAVTTDLNGRTLHCN